MKTTIDLPDDLVIAAKKRAAEDRTTLRQIVESGLRYELQNRRRGAPARKKQKTFRWPTTRGPLPAGIDLRNRETLYDWLTKPE
jgi:hypothetical protein